VEPIAAILFWVDCYKKKMLYFVTFLASMVATWSVYYYTAKTPKEIRDACVIGLLVMVVATWAVGIKVCLTIAGKKI
jgi:hypothetical protein